MLAIAVWGGLLVFPLGSRLVPLGRLDPGTWFMERSLIVADLPLLALLLVGGSLLVADLLSKLVRGTFGSDLLAGMAIVTSLLLGEYLAGVLVVLILLWFRPGLKAAFRERRQASQAEWLSALIPIALVAAFVVLLIMFI